MKKLAEYIAQEDLEGLAKAGSFIDHDKLD
jgi:hypothetical protein